VGTSLQRASSERSAAGSREGKAIPSISRKKVKKKGGGGTTSLPGPRELMMGEKRYFWGGGGLPQNVGGTGRKKTLRCDTIDSIAL